MRCRQMRLWVGALGLSLSSLMLPAAAQDAVKIGVLLPLTGAHASDGDRMLKSHQLAADDINKSGKIKIDLIVGDTQSKPEVGRSEAERLIAREKVSVLLGAWASAVTAPSMQVADRNRVPFIITSAVSDSLTEQGLKFVFRTAPKAGWAGDALADFLAYLKSKGKAINTVALAYEDGPYGQSISKNYSAVLPKHGIKIVAEENFRAGSADMSAQAAKLKASGADAVLIAAYVNDESVLLRALAAQKYEPIIIGYGGGHVHPGLLQLGKLAEKTYGLVEWMNDVKKPAVQTFAADFRARFGSEAVSNQAQAYAATWVSALAAEKAKSKDPVAIRDALATLRISDGPASLLPTDVLAFDESGQSKMGFVVTQVIDGKFVTVWPESVAAQRLVP